MNVVNVNFDDNRWNDIPDLREKWLPFGSELLKTIVGNLPNDEFKDHGFSVNLLLTSDSNIRNLNRNFRGVDKPTNVLSFPQYDEENIGTISTFQKEDTVFLGDIAMSYESIVRESNEFGVKFLDRCSHLFVHSVLHLFGMTHDEPEKEKEMEGLEITILESIGISDPYVLNKGTVDCE